MKILFDQNISHRIISKINHLNIEAHQVKELGLEDSTDLDIWKYAKLNGYAIITFDSDFCDIANLRGHPPKIIWLRAGNTSTTNLAKVLIKKIDIIEDFLINPLNEKLACLEIK